MQKILPEPSGRKELSKNLWQDWNWKLSDGDSKKTIALIQRNVKKQIEKALKQSTKKRKVKYEWQFRVKVFMTPPPTFLAGASGATDPPDPKQPPPPRM